MDRVLVYLGQLRGGEQDGRGRAGREGESRTGRGGGRGGRRREVDVEGGGNRRAGNWKEVER